jgi:hypothetical protein
MIQLVRFNRSGISPYLKLATAQDNDVPVNHRHAETLFLRFRIRLGFRVRVGQEQRDVGAHTEQNKVLHTRAEHLAALKKSVQLSATQTIQINASKKRMQ